mmetsp:Transcript_91963/g.264597  ORF Transcript_91963/g.264597 Transcript_91963/m.264597 type:complete len:272 (-) Transcript_91963:52-867(-)
MGCAATNIDAVGGPAAATLVDGGGDAIVLVPTATASVGYVVVSAARNCGVGSGVAVSVAAALYARIAGSSTRVGRNRRAFLVQLGRLFPVNLVGTFIALVALLFSNLLVAKRHQCRQCGQREAEAPAEPASRFLAKVGVVVQLLRGELQSPTIGSAHRAHDEVTVGAERLRREAKRAEVLHHRELHDLPVRAQWLKRVLQRPPVLHHRGEDRLAVAPKFRRREFELVPIRHDDALLVTSPCSPNKAGDAAAKEAEHAPHQHKHRPAPARGF